MKFNHAKLIGRMREMAFTQEKLSRGIEINESTLNAKLNGKSYFTTEEIDKICDLLRIPNEEIGVYFYSR